MFGKTPHTSDTDTLDAMPFEEILGDEAAAANALEVHELRDRVVQMESQISSQFTSLATYAQIAQEQVEFARSEATAATERAEQRVTSLVERERADRITATTGAPVGSAPDVASRLDALEHSVAHIKRSLDDCRQQQKDLAVAITTMFEHLAPSAPATDTDAPAAPAIDGTLVDTDVEGQPTPATPFAPPVADSTMSYDADAGSNEHADLAGYDGPISGLALNG